MPRRPHLRAPGVAAAVALSLAALAACGASSPGTPHIAPFPLTAGASAPCAAIMAALPATLNGQAREKSAGSRFAAAWGTHPIVLRCGVPEPTAFVAALANKQGPPCQTVNGIDWYLAGDSGNGADPNQPITVTTVYRRPAIEVTVPPYYGTQGPGSAMALLTEVIRAHTTVSSHCL